MTDTANAETRREDRIPVDLNQPIVLSVHNPIGDITVRAAERTDVLIGHVTTGFSEVRGDDESELIVDAHQNRIEVRASSRAGTGWAGISGDVDLDAVVGQITRAFRRAGPWLSAEQGKVRVGGRHAWSDITIEVPRAITGRVEIHSTSGDVRIEGVTTEIALNTMSGDVRAVRTSGDLSLQTASGNLVIEGATGHLTAHTASGDVNVTSAQIQSFHIQTANGDIRINATLSGDGPFHARTVSGDVRLTLRRSTAGGQDPAATLAFHTVSGDADVSPPFRKTDRRLWQAGSGERGPHIDVTTVSGDLAAALAPAASDFVPPSAPTSPTDDVPPVPPTPPAPAMAPTPPSLPADPAPFTPAGSRDELDLVATSAKSEAAESSSQEDAVRLSVLEAVERGEIDVEEALRRLEAVDSIPGT